VLWNLEALLEKHLVAPLAPNYAEAIAVPAIVCATGTSSGSIARPRYGETIADG
jgi:hypothetical protein